MSMFLHSTPGTVRRYRYAPSGTDEDQIFLSAAIELNKKRKLNKAVCHALEREWKAIEQELIKSLQEIIKSRATEYFFASLEKITSENSIIVKRTHVISTEESIWEVAARSITPRHALSSFGETFNILPCVGLGHTSLQASTGTGFTRATSKKDLIAVMRPRGSVSTTLSPSIRAFRNDYPCRFF